MANYTSTHTGATIDASVTIVSGSGVTQSDLTKLNAVTSSAVELNLLDGVTASTAEINILDGLTATTAELNYLDGADSSITTLSLPDNTTITTFGASLIDDADAATARTTLGVDVAGTDNSTDVTLVTTSHDYLSISGQAITLGSIDISDDTNLVGGTGITLTGDTLSTTDSEIVHDNLSGFVTNEHIDHSTVSISAGTGLSGGGDLTSTRTLTIDSSVVTLSGTQTLSNKSISGTANTISNVHIVDDTINTLTIARGGTGGTTSAEARSNLNVDVAGTDNSTDVTLVTTSHDYLSLSGQAITLGTIDIGDDTNLVGGTGITLTGDTLSTTDSEIVHDNLSGFVANEHIDHSGVSITAGAGLTGGGDITATRDIAVGAGTGVTVNADDIAIGQDVGTTQDVTFNSVTADIIGDIRGATKFQAKADVALNKGDAVYISGVSGTTPTVDIADANDSAKMPSFGLAASSVSINASVEIITFGTLAGLNTSGFSVGDILFISTNGTSGNTLTNSAPSGESSLIQNIGIVQRSHASAGSIKVGGAGRTNATPNLDDGDIFIGNGSNQAVTASLNTKIEDYLDGGTSTANFDTISVDGAEITATPAELNVLDGITSTTAELNYTDGVTSNIQTQLDAKAPLASPAFTGTATGANLTLSGDLTVNGSTTTLDTTNLAVEDNLMELNAGVTSNANDSGFLIERGSTGDNAIFMWDESADKFTLGTTTATGTTTGDITLSSTGTLVANVEGDVTGAVTGNADTATTLATARNFSLTGDVTAGAVSFDGSGNVALSTTIAANSVALGTDTTGNYMSDLTEGTGIDITHTPAEGSNATITLDLTEVGFGGGANRLITDDGDGTVSTESNLTFDGTNLDLPDSKKIRLGTSQDLEIYHDGTNSVINNTQTGNLQIYNNVDNGMIELLTDNGSGGTQVFLRADGANNMVRLPVDGVKLTIGDASDLQFYHDGTTNYIRANTTDQDLNFLVNDGGSTITALQIDASNVGQVKLPNDNQELRIGASADLALWHNGSHSFIENTATGNLYITNAVDDADIILQSDDGSGGTTAYLTIDGSASLVNFDKASRHMDSVWAYFGTGLDFKVGHDGSNAYIVNDTTGDLYIQNDLADRDVILRSDDGSGGTTAYITLDGSEARTYANRGMRVPDLQSFSVGNGGDADFFHNGTNTFITNSTGAFYIDQYVDDGDIIFRNDNGSGGVTNYLVIDGGATAIDLLQDTRLKAAKKLFLDGGGNTYIFEESADNVIHYVGGQNKLRFNSTGAIFNDAGLALDFRVEGDTDANLLFVDGSADSVGIGTASPDAKLEVNGSTNSDLFSLEGAGSSFKLIGESGDATSINSMAYRLGLRYGSNDNGYIDFYRGPDGATGYLIFGASGAEKMRISQTGKVGIGTSSPDYELDVAGDIGVDHLITHNSDSNTYVQFTNDRLRFAAGGEVLLDLFEGTQDYVLLGDGGDVDINLNGDMFVRGSDGFVGIGTDSPLDLLHIKSSSTDARMVLDGHTGYDAELKFYEGGSSKYTIGHDSASGNFVIGTANVDTNQRLVIDTSGNVGIGVTSPDAKLEVSESGTGHGSGGIISETTTHNGNAGYRFRTNGTDRWSITTIGDNGGDLRFRDADAGAERMRITSAGNVGIGTTSPSFKLDVAGDARSDRLIFRTNASAPTADAAVYRAADNTFAVSTNNTERMRIDSSGNLLIGATSNRTTVSGYSPRLNTEGAGAAGYVQIVDTENSQFHGGTLALHKYRSGGISANTELGSLYFGGTDSANSTYAQGALIKAYAQGTDSTSNVAADLAFFTNTGSGMSKAMTIDSQRNFRFEDNGTNPSAAASTAFMFNDGGELKVLDELGNTTTISPHNFDLIPGGASEERAWGYYSEKDIVDDEGNVTATQKVNVDMMKLARLVEELTGEKLVYTEED